VQREREKHAHGQPAISQALKGKYIRSDIGAHLRVLKLPMPGAVFDDKAAKRRPIAATAT
jgi:hypothetical protein